MLAFNAKGFPSATASKEDYLNAIRADGFEAAHSTLLGEARDWFASHGHSHESAAAEGKLLHHAAVYHAREAGLIVPDRGALCILLTNVFDSRGVPILAEEGSAAAITVEKFMRVTGLTDEAEARRLYVEASIAEVEANRAEKAGRAAAAQSQPGAAPPERKRTKAERRSKQPAGD